MLVHPHTHSVFSIRDGLTKIEDLIRKSKEYGESFAITDHGIIGAWPTYYNLAKQNDIKPIFGIEIYLNQYRKELFNVLKKIQNADDEEKKILAKERDDLKKHTSHLVLIAKNETGFYNIIQIANEAYVDYFYNKPLVDYNSLFNVSRDSSGSSGMLITTACLASPLSHMLNNNKIDDALEWIGIMKEMFHDDFYLEVQINGIKEQKILNKKIIELSRQTKTKMILGDDTHYLDIKDSEAHQDLLLLQNHNVKSDLGKIDIRVTYENKKGETKTKKVARGKEFRKGILVDELKVKQKFKNGEIIINLEEVPRVWTFSTDLLSFKNEETLRKECSKHHKELIDIFDEIIKSNYEIYDKIENIEFNNEIKLPTIENGDKKIVELVKTALKEKNLLEKKYVDRAKHELNVIKRFKFEAYFLILYDVLKWARENNIALGASRGSVTGSFIAYLLDLHRINPFDERWDFDGDGLPFERFLDMSKLYDKIIVKGDDGETLEFLEIDEISVIRGNKKMLVKASELQKGDEIL